MSYYLTTEEEFARFYCINYTNNPTLEITRTLLLNNFLKYLKFKLMKKLNKKLKLLTTQQKEEDNI